METRMRNLLGSIVFLAALAPGCMTNQSANDRARSELARQRALFEQAGLTSYVVTEQQSCFCAPDTTAAMRVTVTSGSVASVTYVSDGTAVPQNVRAGVKTVAEVFDLIEQQLSDDHRSITVTYDPALHYPTEMESVVPDALDSGLNISLSALQRTAAPGKLSAEACRAIEDDARAAVLPAVEAHVACKVASDCSRVSFDASCFESCYAVVGTGGAAAVQAAKDAVEAKQCVDYHSGGCTLLLPPCAPVPELYCTLGVCTSVPPNL
jgi:Family of unknown function (DUF6174)